MIKGILSILLIVFLNSIAYTNSELFLKSNDFKGNLNAISYGFEWFTLKIAYNFLQFLSFYFDPLRVLILFWSIAVTLNFYCGIFLIRNFTKFLSLNLYTKLLIYLLFIYFLLYFQTSGIFGFISTNEPELIPSAHLLFQYIATSLFLIAIISFGYSKLAQFSILFIAITFHPVIIFYWFLSLNIFNKIGLTKYHFRNFLIRGIYLSIFLYLIAIIIPYLYIYYVNIMGSEDYDINKITDR